MHSTKYGVDVAAARLDRLDRLCLAAVAERGAAGQTSHVLTLGCASGGVETALVKADVKVTAVDVADYSAAFARLRAVTGVTKEQCDYVCADLVQWVAKADVSSVTHVVFQRTLHYLPYRQAQYVLELLSSCPGRVLYVSVTGLQSAIGDAYADADKSVQERWCQLPQTNQNLFHINAPVCLYTKEELQTLLSDTGWNVRSIATTAFGNHQVIADTRAV